MAAVHRLFHFIVQVLNECAAKARKRTTRPAELSDSARPCEEAAFTRRRSRRFAVAEHQDTGRILRSKLSTLCRCWRQCRSTGCSQKVSPSVAVAPSTTRDCTSAKATVGCGLWQVSLCPSKSQGLQNPCRTKKAMYQRSGQQRSWGGGSCISAEGVANEAVDVVDMLVTEALVVRKEVVSALRVRAQ